MSNLSKLQPLVPPSARAKEIAAREKARRRAMGITQRQLSDRSGVALGTLRRFEQTGQLAVESLVRICRALDCDKELETLFSKPAYRSIQEVIDDQRG